MHYSFTNNGEDWDTALSHAINAGTYDVWYKVDGNDEFDSEAPNKISVTVAKADIGYTKPEATTEQVYQGDDITLLVPGSITKGVGHFEYCLTQDGEYTKDIPTGNAATEYTVWYKIVSDDDNYNGVEPQSVTVTLIETLDPPPVKTTVKKTAAGYVFEDLILVRHVRS